MAEKKFQNLKSHDCHVKDAALRKMAVAFKNHKIREWAKYIKGGRKTPVFEGTLENQSAHWDDFVKFKDSELSRNGQE